jgi:hypothetical protein
MKANSVGVEALVSLAEDLLEEGIPLDVVCLDIGEKAVPRTDKDVLRTLIQAYGDGDLVIPLGKDSGLVALEVDEANGGLETLGKLMKKVVIPKTATIVKPAGGPIYILLRFDGTTEMTRKTIGPGLDLVANETCLVVPPKDDSDRSKGWWKSFPTNSEICAVPENLAAFL